MNNREKLDMVLSMLSDTEISWLYQYLCELFGVFVG
jgi:hypothetical protein